MCRNRVFTSLILLMTLFLFATMLSGCSCRAAGSGAGQDNNGKEVIPSSTQTVPEGTAVASAPSAVTTPMQAEPKKTPSENGGPERTEDPSPVVSTTLPSEKTEFTPTGTVNPQSTPRKDSASVSPRQSERTPKETKSAPSESTGPRSESPAASVSHEPTTLTVTPTPTPISTPTSASTPTSTPAPTPTSTAMPTPTSTPTPTPTVQSGSTTAEPSESPETVDEQDDPFRYEGELFYFPDE